MGEALLVGCASVSSSRPVFGAPSPRISGLEAEVWPPWAEVWPSASGDGPLADLAFLAGEPGG